MIRFDRKFVRFMVAGAALLGLPVAALALPLVIDGKPCGDLSKERAEAGSVWSIKGCQPLTDLVNGAVPTPTPPPSTLCGNGIVDPGEVCDTGDTYTCGGKGSSACVSNCTSCNGSTAPTPTPKPTSTPSPVDPECNMGELPPFDFAGAVGWLGIRKVGIKPGETHTWCVPLTSNVRAWTMSIGDYSGAWQCAYHSAQYIPPAGSGLATQSTSQETINSVGNFRAPLGSYLPTGTWKIRLTASSAYPDCPMAYQVTAHS